MSALALYYNIGGVAIAVEPLCPVDDSLYQGFRVPPFAVPDILVKQMPGTHIWDDEDITLSFADGNAKWYNRRCGGILFQMEHPSEGGLLFAMRTNEDFTQAELWHRIPERAIPYGFFGMMGEILFRNYIISRGGMVIHGVSIEHQGKAIIFSAASGVGKTTQADLWLRNADASIINGDRATLILREQVLYTTGSCWSGSSRIFRNRERPMGAIVFLEQAGQNAITALTPQQALPYILPRSFMPYFHQEWMDRALANIHQILEHTSTYLFQNNADPACMQIVKDAVYGA